VSFLIDFVNWTHFSSLILTDLSSCLKTVQSEQFKPIRQCLRQLELLKNVWHSILPSELYNNTMGGLVNSISLDIIKKVTAMEDISTVLSNALVDLIKSSDEKCQALFDSDVNLRDLAQSWEKLVDLQFILDASLVDIQTSWKDGRLPKNFRTDEVKRLIRALFQNTERRANCIQTIV
jgi:protein transport protein DSL1/ZW10